jgi:hypothetical protein
MLGAAGLLSNLLGPSRKRVTLEEILVSTVRQFTDTELVIRWLARVLVKERWSETIVLMILGRLCDSFGLI